MPNIERLCELLKYTVFIIPAGRGKWDVQRWGHQRCLRRQINKRQAYDVAKWFIRNQYGNCRIRIEQSPGCIVLAPNIILTRNSNA